MPIYLAAVGPRNLELAGEIADGWLGVFVSPDYLGEQLEAVARGRERRTGDSIPSVQQDESFAIDATVPVAVGDDVARCAATVAPYAALYVGGMGSRAQNFYNQLAVRMGYEREAGEVQDLYLAKQWRDAAAAVPEAFIDDTSLLGPTDRLAARVQRYADAGVTTLTVAPWGEDLAARMASLEAAAEATTQVQTP